MSHIKRSLTLLPLVSCDNFLYGFKGAPPARRAVPARLVPCKTATRWGVREAA